jgi:DNA-binding XRE family transcriptional regulator
MKNKQKLIKLQDAISQLPKIQQDEIAQKARFIQVAMVVRNLRKDLDLAQIDLAKQLGKKREFISRIESGKQNITLETLYHIAEATKKKVFFEFR